MRVTGLRPLTLALGTGIRAIGAQSVSRGALQVAVSKTNTARGFEVRSKIHDLERVGGCVESLSRGIEGDSRCSRHRGPVLALDGRAMRAGTEFGWALARRGSDGISIRSSGVKPLKWRAAAKWLN